MPAPDHTAYDELERIQLKTNQVVDEVSNNTFLICLNYKRNHHHHRICTLSPFYALSIQDYINNTMNVWERNMFLYRLRVLRYFPY